MNVLITGGTGFLGNNLVRLLLERGGHPLCPVRPGSSTRPLDGLGATVLVGRLEDPRFVHDIVRQADAVVHSAALIHIGWTRMDESIAVNEGLSRRLAEAAAEQGKRFIHVSSVDTLAAARPDRPNTECDRDPPKPPCAYVVSKRRAEEAVWAIAEAGLNATIVHPGFMVGPFDWKPSSGQMMLALANRFAPIAPGGGCSVVDVRDVARGIAALLERPRGSQRRYILAGHNIPYLQLWRDMASVVGRRGPWDRLRPPIAWIAGAAGDAWARLRGREPTVNSAAVRMGQLFHYYSSAQAERDLGYSFGPYLPALREAWMWFRQEGLA